MIRLGHIEYSNCFPLHAELLERRTADVQVVRGVPSELNRALATGEIGSCEPSGTVVNVVSHRSD